MGKRYFEVEFWHNYDLFSTGTLELDDRVIDVVDDEWRSKLYDLRTPEDIAEHIAYNLVINGIGLSRMDGWADQPNENARMIHTPDLSDFELEANEITSEEANA
jgi:hypothetical protein